MAVGMIVEQAVAQPQHVDHAEIVVEPLLDLGLAQPGVAIGVEQALLGGDGTPGAVAVDRAALENPAARLGGDPQPCTQPPAAVVVARPIVFAAPAVAVETPPGPARYPERPGIGPPAYPSRLTHHPRRRPALAP